MSPPGRSTLAGIAARSSAEKQLANPFTIGRDGSRDEVIAKYELYLYASGLIAEIGNLRGLNLVCWCLPQACHGDVLLRLAYAGPRLCSCHGQDADDLRIDHIVAQLEEVKRQKLTDSYLSDVMERRDTGDQ